MSITQFAKLMGVIYVLVGLLGFIPGLVSPASDLGMDLAVTMGFGYLLGLFPINVLHNVVHLAIGAWGWVSSGSVTSSRTFARGLAVFYGALAVMGLIPVLNTVFGMIPIFGHDVWLHTATAVLAAYFGFASPQSAIVLEEQERRVA